MDNTDFADFLRDILGITQDYGVAQIEKFEHEKLIKIHLEYLPKRYRTGGGEYPLYDTTPMREWQHLSWFEYRSSMVCSSNKPINNGWNRAWKKG